MRGVIAGVRNRQSPGERTDQPGCHRETEAVRCHRLHIVAHAGSPGAAWAASPGPSFVTAIVMPSLPAVCEIRVSCAPWTRASSSRTPKACRSIAPSPAMGGASVATAWRRPTAAKPSCQLWVSSFWTSESERVAVARFGVRAIARISVMVRSRLPMSSKASSRIWVWSARGKASSLRCPREVQRGACGGGEKRRR